MRYRTIFALLCISLVTLPVIYSVSLQLQAMMVRHEMKESLEKEQLVTLHLSESAIHWYKKDKELLIGTSLFDVKSITRTASGYVVTGLFDEKEKMIKAHLQHLTHEDGKQQKLKTLPLFQCWFFADHRLAEHPLLTKPVMHYPIYAERILTNAYPVVIPPPKELLFL